MNPFAQNIARVASSLLATILVSTLFAPVASAVTVPTVLASQTSVNSDQCSDVIFIGARGSGEDAKAGQPKQSSDEKDRMEGFGDTVASMAFSIKQQLPPETTTSFLAVDYRALSVPEAMVIDSKYPASVQTGIDNGTPLVKETIASCPWSKVILMGYSQGAHVMHEIIMRLDRNERDHVSSALLIADPIRYPADKNTLFTYVGEADNFALTDSIIFRGKGAMRRVAELESACRAAEDILDRSPYNLLVSTLNPNEVKDCNALFAKKPTFSDVMTPGYFAEDISNRILNVCNEGDLVCQVVFESDKNKDAVDDSKGSSTLTVRTATVKDLGFVKNILVSFKLIDQIHGEGYKETKFYDFPSQWSVSMLGRSPKLPEKPTPTATPTPTQTPAPEPTNKSIAAPSFGEESWRQKAKSFKERGASGYNVYTNNSDGAVIAFEDFFRLMAWEFSTKYKGDEDSASTEAEKNKLIDRQLFRTMEYVDRPSLGTEKVNSIFGTWARALALVGNAGAEIKASRDGVSVSPDGTVTITERHVFFKDPTTGEIVPLNKDAGGEYKLAYKNEKWVVVDVNVNGPLDQ